MLSNFRWYRRLRGGRWEGWYIEHLVCSVIWDRVSEFGKRPLGAIGIPQQEDYTVEPLLNEQPCGCHDHPTYGHVIMGGCPKHD